MHVNKFLYKHFHSWHHRLYVPYAFGALYNHPVEGFILDSLGAAIAELITGLSMRQAMVLFTLSTFKTVDDHCGYNFPWDPLQLMSGNNADYHDIHHQVSLMVFVSVPLYPITSAGHRYQVQLRPALLRALGYPSRDAHDQGRH